LAREISVISVGSIHTRFLPQPRTEAARRFWSFRETIWGEVCKNKLKKSTKNKNKKDKEKKK